MLISSSRLWRLAAAAFVAAALGFGLAACGGGDDEDPAPVATTTPEETAVITQSELIDQGDALCAEVNAALGSIESSTADETTKTSQIENLYDGLATRLSELGTPSDGEAPTAVIAAAEDLADGGGDSETFRNAAGAYGFNECAEAPVTTSYPSDTGGVDGSTGAETPGTYVPPATETPEPPPTTTPTPNPGGGVAPSTPDPGGSSGGSSGGGSSGGIGPG